MNIDMVPFCLRTNSSLHPLPMCHCHQRGVAVAFRCHLSRRRRHQLATYLTGSLGVKVSTLAEVLDTEAGYYGKGVNNLNADQEEEEKNKLTRFGSVPTSLSKPP